MQPPQRLRGIKVKFTQQQIELLDKLAQEGTYGKTYPDIVVAVFREYITQTFGKRGA